MKRSRADTSSVATTGKLPSPASQQKASDEPEVTLKIGLDAFRQKLLMKKVVVANNSQPSAAAGKTILGNTNSSSGSSGSSGSSSNSSSSNSSSSSSSNSKRNSSHDSNSNSNNVKSSSSNSSSISISSNNSSQRNSHNEVSQIEVSSTGSSREETDATSRKKKKPRTNSFTSSGQPRELATTTSSRPSSNSSFTSRKSFSPHSSFTPTTTPRTEAGGTSGTGGAAIIGKCTACKGMVKGSWDEHNKVCPNSTTVFKSKAGSGSGVATTVTAVTTVTTAATVKVAPTAITVPIAPAVPIAPIVATTSTVTGPIKKKKKVVVPDEDTSEVIFSSEDKLELESIMKAISESNQQSKRSSKVADTIIKDPSVKSSSSSTTTTATTATATSSSAVAANFPASKPEGTSTKSRSSSGGGGAREWNFAVDYNDHFETPEAAYLDLLPLIDAWCQQVGKTRSTVTIYDPYYCKGKVVSLFKQMGFKNVINENRDFYDDISNCSVPEHDILITNPPYSGEHKQQLLDYLSSYKKPFALLLPAYTASKSYWREFEEEKKKKLLYIMPSASYEYSHPEGTGKDIPPFYSCWFCHGFTAQPSSFSSSSQHNVDYVYSVDEMIERKFIKGDKRPNPKQRLKLRAKSLK